MLKRNKILSVLLVVTLIMGISTSAFAAESKPSTINNVSIEEYDKLISDMLEATENIEIKGDTVIYIPVKSGRLSGTVIIEEKPVFEIAPQSSKVFTNIPDGKRVLTTTLKADVILGGEMMLKSYYTMKNNGSAIDVTRTEHGFSPPLGYTNGGSTSYIVTDRSTNFMTKGSYTMNAVGKIPLTIRAVHSVTLVGKGAIHLNYYKEV